MTSAPIIHPPAIVAQASASCVVFGDACAVKVYRAITKQCFTRNGRITIRFALSCYRINQSTHLYDRQPWLKSYEPYVVRHGQVLVSPARWYAAQQDAKQ